MIRFTFTPFHVSADIPRSGKTSLAMRFTSNRWSPATWFTQAFMTECIETGSGSDIRSSNLTACTTLWITSSSRQLAAALMVANDRNSTSIKCTSCFIRCLARCSVVSSNWVRSASFSDRSIVLIAEFLSYVLRSIWIDYSVLEHPLYGYIVNTKDDVTDIIKRLCVAIIPIDDVI